MTKKIITTYIEYDSEGKIKSKSITEAPYPEDDDKPEVTDYEYTNECIYDNDDDDDDAVYVVTPKGIATLALLDAGLVDDFDDHRIDLFWDLFEKDMQAHGYVQEEAE